MKIILYDKLWQDIEQKNWPKPGQIFVCKDPQERLGPDTWAVAKMKLPHEHDLTNRGLFWQQKDAIIFANALNEQEKTELNL